MKIVINSDFGGMSLSEEAYQYLGIPWDNCGWAYGDTDKRTAPELVECVERLGAKANGKYAKLKVVEIPDDVEYTIEEYDGREWIAEVHREWH